MYYRLCQSFAFVADEVFNTTTNGHDEEHHVDQGDKHTIGDRYSMVVKVSPEEAANGENALFSLMLLCLC